MIGLIFFQGFPLNFQVPNPENLTAATLPTGKAGHLGRLNALAMLEASVHAAMFQDPQFPTTSFSWIPTIERLLPASMFRFMAHPPIFHEWAMVGSFGHLIHFEVHNLS
jgi:hypothetical protein